MPPQLDSLIADMEAFGLVIDRDLRWDGAVVRLRMRDQRGSDRPGWFIGKEVGGKHYAHYGTWQDRDRDARWTDNGAGTPVCVEQWRQLAALREQWARQEQEQAAKTAAEMWAQADEAAAAAHPYVLKKGVQPHGLRVLRPDTDNELLVPYSAPDGAITTVQRILPDGLKLLLTHGRIEGCCHIIPGDKSTIYICEGWATGASINELTGREVLVACSAGNLTAAARAARQSLPDATIIIAADNDHKTEAEGKGNPGLKYAAAAAQAIGAELVAPEGTGSDFNDMVAAGFAGRATEILIGKPPVMISIEEIMVTEYKPIHWAVKGIIPEGFTLLAGRPKFGKSWLMLGLAHAVASGTPAWNYGETNRCGVLYLALEDSPRRIKDRMEMMCYDTYPKNLYVATDAPKLGATPDGGKNFIPWIEDILRAHPDIKLVIIDTLQKIRPVATGKRNLYQAEYDDFSSLQKLAISKGVIIIGVHHTRKRSTKGEILNPMDEISGSTGIQGVADTIIVCTRDGVNGQMYVTGREVNEATYPMTFDRIEMRWSLSAPEEQNVDVGPMLLTDWFKTHSTITAREAAEMFGVNLRTAQRKLKTLVIEGKLTANEPKNPKDPIAYSPTAIFSYT